MLLLVFKILCLAFDFSQFFNEYFDDTNHQGGDKRSNKFQVNIEEDDTRIYVDIGNGGHVGWILFV